MAWGVDPSGTWAKPMLESYRARSEWERTHPPERMKEPGIYAEKPPLDPLRGFLSELVPPDPRVDPEGFRERVHEELVTAPLLAIPPVGLAAKAAPRMGLNLLKGASKKVPKSLQKTLHAGMKQYSKGAAKENIFKGISLKNILYEGLMDYGSAGKRALFTVELPGHALHGTSFSGPRVWKAARVGIGKKKKVFVLREGQQSHLDIFKSLPDDMQGGFEAGYMIGNEFVPKGKLEKPVRKFAKDLLKSEKGAVTVGGKTEAQIDKEILDITPKEVKEQVRKMLDSWKKDDFKKMAEASEALEAMGYNESAVTTITRAMREAKKVKK